MSKTIVLVTKQGLGTTGPEDAAFGIEMLDKFFHTLETRENKPEAICFYTEGVKLVCEGSPLLAALQLLTGLGVRIVACQTCLTHYGLQQKVEVGESGGMVEIVSLMEDADKVITV
jgi:sulfur relay (sulfurtransferase) complex TusBCD TusD component (DsrE family)